MKIIDITDFVREEHELATLEDHLKALRQGEVEQEYISKCPQEYEERNGRSLLDDGYFETRIRIGIRRRSSVRMALPEKTLKSRMFVIGGYTLEVITVGEGDEFFKSQIFSNGSNSGEVKKVKNLTIPASLSQLILDATVRTQVA